MTYGTRIALKSIAIGCRFATLRSCGQEPDRKGRQDNPQRTRENGACSTNSSGCRIDSQHFYQVGYLAQMAQGVAGGFVVSAEKVGIEHIFPGTSAAGTRLDLGQADIAQSKYRQRLEQRAGECF